jgi:tetratricopeptide (TPR) repeat protein
MSVYHLFAGRPREALEEARRGAEQEPLSAIAQTQAAAGHVACGDIEGAVQFLEKALELDPGMPIALLWLGFCRSIQGRLQEAEALMRASLEHGLPGAQVFLAEVLARAGRIEEARAIVRTLEETAGQCYVSPLALAFAHASVGEKDRCLALLDQAEQERSAIFTLFLFGPGYLSLSPACVKEWFAARRDRVIAARAQPRTGPMTSTEKGG